nr:sarcosine oxidase subunit gamma [Pararhodobacter sp. SW119]
MGECRLATCAPQLITSVAPRNGREAAVDAVLRDFELGFPTPGKMIVSGSARIIWAGRETAFLMGVEPPAGLRLEAALTVQSDGWAGLHLTGSGAEAVLARLIPLDLRLSTFAVHDVARTLLNHMPCLIFRPAKTAFEIYVFRSMAGTAVHELTEAMRSVAARQAVWQE